jgi:hypothetical protein
MKRKSSIITLLLILAVLFGMAFKCGKGGGNTRTRTRNNTRNTPADTPPTPRTATDTGGGFEDGHALKGRYSNADQGIRSFTFYTDGRFERGGASAGSYRGGEYSSGATNSGTYYLSGKTLSLTDDDGNSAGDLRIEIVSFYETPDYSAESPATLKIDGVGYTKVD